MFDANREHKDTLARMEQKFFEEKVGGCLLLLQKYINSRGNYIGNYKLFQMDDW